MRPFRRVTGRHIASQSATDLITLVLNNSTKHHRWSVPGPASFLHTGHAITPRGSRIVTHDGDRNS